MHYLQQCCSEVLSAKVRMDLLPITQLSSLGMVRTIINMDISYVVAPLIMFSLVCLQAGRPLRYSRLEEPSGRTDP